MAIDWASLVANSSPETAESPRCDDLFRQKVGTESEGVGTEGTQQSIESKKVSDYVPTVPTVPSVFERERGSEYEKFNHSSFLEPVGGGLQRQSAPHKTTTACPSCKTCAHRLRPGLSDGLCSGRNDLPLAYTPGHPLRQLPADGGASCTTWRLHLCL